MRLAPFSPFPKSILRKETSKNFIINMESKIIGGDKMSYFKRSFAAIFAFFYVVIFSSSSIVFAAVTKPAIPQIRFVSAPVREYTAGDRIKFDIQSPGYSGRVEYRVVLWEDAKKSYSDLWNPGNGYPTRFYTKWRPTGGTTFNLGWVINKPGSYRITVYVRRVGYSGKMLAKPGANCDSYMESVAFTVKPREIIVDKQGGVYGSNNPASYYEINSSVRVKARDVTYNNTQIHGDMHILAGNISLNNVRVDGTLYINPGEYETVNLNDVYAKEIQMLSDKNDAIELKNIGAETLKLNFPDKKKVIAGEKTSIAKTIINNNMIIDKISGSFGQIYLVRDDLAAIDLVVMSQMEKGITTETNAYIKVENEDPEKSPFSLSQMNILSPKGKVITATLDGAFEKVNIWRTAQVNLINNTYVNELASYANSRINMDETTKIGTLDSKYEYNSVSVLANGKIEKTYGDIRYLMDKSNLPGEDMIAGVANAGVHFGIDEEIDDKGIVENPAIRFRLLNTDGSVLSLRSGGDAFFDYGEMVEKFKNTFEGYMYSIPVNKDDGTIELNGGSYRLYLPSYDNKWYVLSFTTKQVGAAGEYRSELTSINGKPYSYIRWKANPYTPISGYVTLGTSLNDAVKILGNPGKTYIDSNGYYAVYYYPSKPMIHYSSYIEMYKINGQFVVTGWNNNNGLKVSVGTRDPGAPYIKVGSLKAEVARAMGTPPAISYENDGLEYWKYSGGNIIKFFDNRVVGWVNKGGLKVYIGDKVSGAPPINFSSTMTDVIRAMGTPTTFTEGWNGFGYGESGIHFSEKTGKVDSWDNKGNLIIASTIDTSIPGFTIGSTMEEVYRISGAPTRIQLWTDNSGYWVYGIGNYNVSTVYFDKDGRVTKFENDGKLRVSMGTIDPTAPPFFLGSAREDVIKAQGTPHTAYFDGYGRLNLYYNEGQVIIDKDGRVVEYNNTKGLKVGLSNFDPAAKPYFIGASMEEVAGANGAPDSAAISINGEITWKYGSSELKFDETGKLIRYNNTGNLKVGFLEKDPASPGFTIGSTMEEVARANGTPAAAAKLPNGYTNWQYGNSSVGFDPDGRVISYSNAGELLVNLGEKGTSDTTYFIGSTQEEVTSINGTPDEVGKSTSGTNTTFYRYGTSYVYFNNYGRIVEYYNTGNLKVSAGNMDPSSKPFFTGSTRDEVIKANGTPTQVYANTNQWYYGKSYVYFDSNGRVERYYNSGELKAGIGEKDPSSPPFFYGSTMEEVIDAQGSPTNAAALTDGTSEWGFGISTVKFDSSGRVTDISYAKNLKVGLRDKADNKTFKLGSSMEEVTIAMGTPDHITSAAYNNTIIFEYSYSTVIFDKSGKVIGYDNSRKNLNVNMGERLFGASPFTLGSSMDDVIRSNDAPEAVTPNASGCTFRYSVYGSGSALVFFDRSGIVSGWNNSRVLNMIKVSPDPSAPPVTIGSSFDDVIKAMGTPISYNNSSTKYDRTLVYVNSNNAESMIYMDKDGKVAAWEDLGKILRVVQ